jgi:hypothetical protein
MTKDKEPTLTLAKSNPSQAAPVLQSGELDCFGRSELGHLYTLHPGEIPARRL